MPDTVYSPPGPVGRAFMLSDAFVRIIMGPYGCLSCDTEFLSPRGWVRMDNYNGEDIAEFDLQTRSISFRKPIEYIILPCNEFIHLKTLKTLDMLLSSEHTVIYDTRFAPNQFKKISAQELAAAHAKLKDGWSGRIPNVFKLEARPDLPISDGMLRLSVAIAADGSLQKYGQQVVIDVRKERKAERLIQLLSSLGIKYELRIYSGRPLDKVFVFRWENRTKPLTQFWGASERQLRIIFDEIPYWDGHVADDGYTMFSSSKKDEADFVQYAAACLGRRASITEIKYDNPKWRTNYRVNWGKSDQSPYASLRGASKPEIVPSTDGWKYCFKTSTGAFIARRNNAIFITGNSGKSTCCCMDIIRRAREMPKCTDGVRRSRVAVIRNTSPQLNTTTIKTWHQWIPMHIGHWRSEGPACHRIIDGDMDLEVMFVALDRPQDVAKLLSLELTMAWINEVREISRTVFEGCTGRLRRFPSRALLPAGVQYFSGMICDTNPPDSDGWLYKLMEENKPENYAIFKQPSALSPDGENLANLDPRYYKDMMAGKTQEWINVYVHGQYGFIADGRPVFPEYSDVVHCKDVEPDKRLELYVGIDFGRTPCAVFGQKTKNGQWRILDELCTEDMGARDFAEELNRVITKNYDGFAIGGIYGDPAGDQRPQTEDTTPFQILRACGIHAKPAPTQDFTKRREAVAYYLSRMFEGEPGMVISPKCKMLRKGFNGGYCWQRVGIIGKEIFKDMPTKNEWSHCQDSLQYALCGAGESRMIVKRRPIKADNNFYDAPLANEAIMDYNPYKTEV